MHGIGRALCSQIMNPKYKKIYCCTPVAFHANDGFWIRDTGLISNTLRSMGVESKCIMPLPYYDDDQKEHLIRNEYKNLKSVTWWKNLDIDACVLYSWGAPKYTLIARAIHKAGIKLVIHMDTSGNFTINDKYKNKYLLLPFVYLKLQAQNILRSKHLSYADVITTAEPVAKHISQLPFYNHSIFQRNFPMPCPVSPKCKYDGESKRDVILAIGRWDDERQKRSQFLMKTIELFYQGGGTAVTKIYGTLTEQLIQWHQGLPSEYQKKIQLLGYLKNELLWNEYRQSKILLCTSSFESSHIVSAEALCCGCSIVTTHRPAQLRCLLWYTTHNSGTISSEDSPESLALALQQELKEWELTHRFPADIASYWQPFFHADKVFNKIFES